MTNIGEMFLRLIDQCYPKNHTLRHFCNRNTIKLSYRCTPNMGSSYQQKMQYCSNHHKNQTRDYATANLKYSLFTLFRVENTLPGKQTLGCQIQILFYTVNYTYIESTYPRGQVSSCHRQLLAAVQSSASNLTKIQNPKFIKGNWPPYFFRGPPKNNRGSQKSLVCCKMTGMNKTEFTND